MDIFGLSSRHGMSSFEQIAILSVLIVLVSTQVQAQEEKPTGKPGVVRVETATITATVEGIDYDKRTDLKGPRGNMVTLKVGPEAKNFKQIKTGDHVTAKYYRATAIYVRKPDEPPFAEAASAGTEASVVSEADSTPLPSESATAETFVIVTAFLALIGVGIATHAVELPRVQLPKPAAPVSLASICAWRSRDGAPLPEPRRRRRRARTRSTRGAGPRTSRRPMGGGR